MNNWFANIGVSRKLALGFGVVLALTLILAWNGWGSLGSVIQRSGWMTEISLLNKTLTDLRIARLQFMLANGDAESTERLDKNLGIYLAQQTKLLNTFNNPANVALLKEQAGYNAQYQNSLNDMRKAYAQANGARTTIDGAATRLGELIAGVTNHVLQLPDYEEDRFAQLLAISQIKEDVQRAQYLLRVYMAAPANDAVKAIYTQLDTAQATLGRHAGALDANSGAALQQIRTVLDEYRSAIQALETATQAIAKARQEMTDQQKEIVRISDSLYQFQLDRLDVESSVLTITRQIILPLRTTKIGRAHV